MADTTQTTGELTVRYWASARAAAGVAEDTFAVSGPTTLADVLAEVRRRHADRPTLDGVLSCCSVLVGDRPVTGQDAAGVVVRPGDSVELLPPFAGG